MSRFSFPLRALGVAALALLAAAPAFAQTTATRSRAGGGATGAEQEVFMTTLQAISRMHMSGVADSTLWEAAIDGMIAALDDPYASVFNPTEAEAWEEETTGNYSGIGLQITAIPT